MKTIQDNFIENIKSDTETGITFIEGGNSTEHLSYLDFSMQDETFEKGSTIN